MGRSDFPPKVFEQIAQRAAAARMQQEEEVLRRELIDLFTRILHENAIPASMCAPIATELVDTFDQYVRNRSQPLRGTQH